MTEAHVHSLITDPLDYARHLSRLHDAVLAGTTIDESPRQLIAASWQRSLSARVDPEATGPHVVMTESEVIARRDKHPLATCIPMLRQVLLSVADQAMHVMIITDAAGRILWREGHSRVQRLADDVGLSPGALWAEDAIGTNAMGTTLAVDRPVQIYSAEHLVRTYHTWTCAAAPVHDPDTGDILGAIDISGPLKTIHPATVALVTAAAKLAENQLQDILTDSDNQFIEANRRTLAQCHGQPAALITQTGRVVTAEPADWLQPHTRISGTPQRLPNGPDLRWDPIPGGFLVRGTTPPPTTDTTTLHLRLLTDDTPTAELNGNRSPLAPRHAEILALLATAPRGLNADQLALHLYGDDGNPTTVRAEIHRLRTQLGPHVIGAKPYRLTRKVTTDFTDVANALRHGDVMGAATAYTGPLLPRSQAPGIWQQRQEQLAALRTAVLAHDDVEALWMFARVDPGDGDLDVLENLAKRLAPADPRRWWVEARITTVVAGG